MGIVKFDDQNDQRIIRYALTHCLPRPSVAPSIMSEWLVKHWGHVTPDTRGFVFREILQAIYNDEAGDDKDKEGWFLLLTKLLPLTPPDQVEAIHIECTHIDNIRILWRKVVIYSQYEHDLVWMKERVLSLWNARSAHDGGDFHKKRDDHIAASAQVSSTEDEMVNIRKLIRSIKNNGQG